MRRWGASFRPLGIKPRSIGQINVQPAVVVVVKEGQPTALGFNDKPLVIQAAPHIRGGEAGLAGHIHKFYETGGSGTGKALGVERGRALPFPPRGGNRLEQGRAESHEGGAEETSSSNKHDYRMGAFGKLRGTIPVPSFTAMILSTGRSVNLSTCPLGQVITSDSIRERLPRPK